MQILELQGECKDYLWGGTRLREEYGKESDKEIIAESWELSARKDGNSIIKNGDFKGKTLAEYIEANGIKVLGTRCEKYGGLPVLIKLIDAKKDLSVQVHPNDEYAFENEGEPGKTEMWYVIDCEPDAKLVYGLNEELTREEFRECIENNTLTEKLNYEPVRKGDVFYIPSGTIHAIGKGILIAEIQENSNTTYRVYDYNRKDKDGNTRPLHIEKALDVANLSPAPQQERHDTEMYFENPAKILCKCDYFIVIKIEIRRGTVNLFADASSFHHILVIDGEGNIECGDEKIEVKKGSSIFIPAGNGVYKISGKLDIICTKV